MKWTKTGKKLFERRRRNVVQQVWRHAGWRWNVMVYRRADLIFSASGIAADKRDAKARATQTLKFWRSWRCLHWGDNPCPMTS